MIGSTYTRYPGLLGSIFLFCISFSTTGLSQENGSEAAESEPVLGSAESAAESETDLEADVSDAEGATGGEAEDELEKEAVVRRSRSLGMNELTGRERRQLERMLSKQGPVLYRGEVPYIREWSFRSGVAELNVPAYDGWINVTKNRDLYVEFAGQGVPGQTLSGVFVNQRYISRTQSSYINFYVTAWVPERHAFKIFSPEAFAPIKETLQDELIEVRQNTVQREEFDSFDDYLNFKFGRDEAVENFVDGRLIKASEDDDFVTYFFTSEFFVQDEKSPLFEPMVGTTTFGLVRGKLVRFDVRMAYRGRDDVARILEFAQQYFEDLKRVNGVAVSKRR